jgi:hypothetical protein
VRLMPHVDDTERTSAKPQVGRRKEARPRVGFVKRNQTGHF